MVLVYPTILFSGEMLVIGQSQKIAVQATASTKSWRLPPSGPAALADKTVVYIAEDLRNGGILGVGAGVREAAAAIGWKVRFLDIGSQNERREAIFAEALSMDPDAVILGGMDGLANSRYLKQFAAARIPIVGWHVAPFPGPVVGTPIQVNVTTDSLEVARTAAHYVIADSAGTASVMIFTDSRFAIAMQKSDAMAEIIRGCKGCTVLEVIDVALNQAAQQLPAVMTTLMEKFARDWTYSLGINDLYFDHAVIPLVTAGYSPTGPPFNISAGDGSASAFLRIRNGSYQKATVPEPLLFHGWQLVDEINRLLQKHSPSGYVTPPHIVTLTNIWPKTGQVNLFDPQNGYRESYIRYWKKTPPK